MVSGIALVPLALKSNTVLMLFLYGAGTALPVLVIALILAFAANRTGSLYNRLRAVEK
ncbi:MAG: hypothetical protein ACLFQK_03220 [Fibrobacterota bacterium]